VHKLKEVVGQDVLQIKNLSQRETTLYLEVSSLRQADKETKKLIFQKSEEALRAHTKILDLCKEVIDLQEKMEGSQAKMVRLKERATQQEVQLRQLERELARKVELNFCFSYNGNTLLMEEVEILMIVCVTHF